MGVTVQPIGPRNRGLRLVQTGQRREHYQVGKPQTYLEGRDVQAGLDVQAFLDEREDGEEHEAKDFAVSGVRHHGSQCGLSKDDADAGRPRPSIGQSSCGARCHGEGQAAS